jgi:hypothetical protein
MEHTGTFLKIARLRKSNLPDLVQEQRTLEAAIAPHAAAILKPLKPGVPSLVDQEKAKRKEIDALLVKAGLKNTELVTVNGYEVVHYSRAGLESVNIEKLAALLEAHGMDPLLVAQLVADATETAADVEYALVKVPKGAKVKKAAA